MGGAACDAGSKHLEPVDTPPVRLVELRVTTSLDASGAPVRTKVEPSGATGVLSTTSLHLSFDRFLDPEVSALRQSVCLQSSTAKVTSFENCTDDPVFLEPTYDPLRREVTFRQAKRSATDPATKLAPGTLYRLTILAPVGAARTGIRAFDGAPLAGTVAFDLKIADADPPNAPDEAVSSSDLFCKTVDCTAACEAQPDVKTCEGKCLPSCGPTCACDMTVPDCFKACSKCKSCKPDCLAPCQKSCPRPVRKLLTESCGFATCHGTSQDGLGPSMGLDLHAPGFIALTALGHVAHQTEEGERANDPEETPLRFGRAMPLIDPNNAGNSYLLYKLVANAKNYAVDPTNEDRGPDGAPLETSDPILPASAEEIERLRESVVVGMPMPPKLGASDSIGGKDVAAISAWITQGAAVTCP